LAWSIVEGLECHLVLEERVPGSYDPDGSGNNLLFRLLGASSITVVKGAADVRAETAKVAAGLRERGKRPFVIPGGAADPVGALGYAACAAELEAQALKLGLDLGTVVCASGSGGTHAGLLAGFRAARTPAEVLGVNVRRQREEDQAAVVEALANDTLRLLGVEDPVEKDSVKCFAAYLGPGYSLPDEGTLEAIRLLARTEAVLVDPVYTGKALAGLIGLARDGRLPKGSQAVFLHTGGVPALFSYPAGLWTAQPSALGGRAAP
jgi:D-cysteine desulfhydrase